MAAKENDRDSVIDSTETRQQRYEALVDAYYRDIFRYAYWLSKSRQQAEDLTQETFLRAWRAFDSLQSPATAKAWLFTILRRENARRFEKFQPELDDIEDHQSAILDTRHNEPDQQMEMRLLYKAIAALEPEYREPLILQVVGGFSGDEIGNMLNLNNNTVMTRLFRARNKLKAVLDADKDGQDSHDHE